MTMCSEIIFYLKANCNTWWNKYYFEVFSPLQGNQYTYVAFA